MDLHGKSLIGGAPAAEGAHTYSAYDPSEAKELAPPFSEATASQVERAMALAAEAFEDYREKPGAERADFLERIADEILALDHALISRCKAETGLPEQRLVGERARTVGQLRMFADLAREGSWVDARIDTAMPDRQPLPKPDLRQMRVPIGPVVVFGASNFPLAFSVAGGDTASALASGCPVIVKAHRSHPGTSEMVGRAIVKAARACGMPEGVFALLHGRGQQVGIALVTHPATKAVGFTGSLRGGRALFDAAAARPEPIPVYAEMGSLNPIFLLPGALDGRADAFAQGLCQSVTLGVGQFCTNPGLVFGLKGEPTDRFLQAAAERFSQTLPETMLHPGICDAYRSGVNALQAVQGVRLVGETSQKPDPGKTHAAAHIFTADLNTFFAHTRLAEEIFGPCTLVVTCENRAELERVARQMDGQLTATLHGTEADLKTHRKLISILEQKVGRLIFNGFPTGVEVCPSMIHGGPYPATTDSRSTSVGTAAIYRFARPVCYQNFPQAALPSELQDDNPRGIWRLVNSRQTQGSAQTS